MDVNKFIWTVGDRQYVLVPEVRQSPRKTWVMGAGMYSLDGEYVGYWHRAQMPITLIHGLTAHWKRIHEKGRLATGTVPIRVYRRSKRR